MQIELRGAGLKSKAVVFNQRSGGMENWARMGENMARPRPSRTDNVQLDFFLFFAAGMLLSFNSAIVCFRSLVLLSC
jgi:hypothetical protein